MPTTLNFNHVLGGYHMLLTSILGCGMAAVGSTGLIKVVGKPAYQIVKQHHSDKKKAKYQGKFYENTESLTKLFKNMGLMKHKDWIKVIDYINTDTQEKWTFNISDSLSVSSFIKKLDDIQQKMKLAHLEITSCKDGMQFSSRKPNIQLVPYQYYKIPQSSVMLGYDLDYDGVYWNLKVTPHCGVFAETNSGKSRQIHSMICHIIQNNPRSSLYLIDLKNGMEFNRYTKLSMCKGFAKNIEDAKRLIAALEEEAERRFNILEEEKYCDYNDYLKDKPRTNLTRIFIFIDEIADLQDDKKEKTKNGKVEGFDAVGTLKRLARKMRSVGMHLCVSTQRPTTDYIDAGLKASLGLIIGMKVVNERNSELIIDEKGLELLHPSQCIKRGDGDLKFFLSFKILNSDIDSVIGSSKQLDNPTHHEDDVKIEVINPDGSKDSTQGKIIDNIFKK